MKNKDDIRNELRNISPFLGGKLPKKQGYRVPQNYFKQLPEELMKQAAYTKPGLAEKKENPKKRSWLAALFVDTPFPSFQKRMAFGLSLLFLAAYLTFDFYKNNDPYHQLSQLSATEVSQYLDENIEDFEWDDLVEANIVSNQAIDFGNGNQADADLIDNYLEEAELELEEELENNNLFSI